MKAAAAQQPAQPPLRVAMVWNGAVFAEHLLTEPTAVTLGSGKDALFPLPQGFSEDDNLTLLQPEDSGYALQPLPGMAGSLFRAGQAEPVADLQRAHAESVRLRARVRGVQMTAGGSGLGAGQSPVPNPQSPIPQSPVPRA